VDGVGRKEVNGLSCRYMVAWKVEMHYCKLREMSSMYEDVVEVSEKS
jgi:hypothetical protein